MNFPAQLFPSGWSLAAFVPLFAILVWVVRTAPWGRLKESTQSHVFLGFVVALALLWTLQAGVRPGLNYHLLGATVAVLAFGPQLGIVALCAVLAATTFNGAAAWQTYGLNAMVMIAVPVAIAQGIYWLVVRFLPAHLFVFIFANAFFGAWLNTVLTGIAASGILYVASVYPAEQLLDQYLPYFVLLGFSEGTLSGMAITLMVVYRPGRVVTFDDSRYLLNK
ncbi:MAG: energy-coupling factor ABC transporter permease [Betaproteobacteria bacterium]|nr:energy-coupling factor ABC transporter permease [Betaproteobacteria bacterium]